MNQDYLVWDRFFNLLFPCDGDATDAEVDADLKRFGINMGPAYERLHKMVAAHRAKSQLATARATRMTLMEKLQSIVAPAEENLRENLRKWITSQVIGNEQLAYFHKLESAATDDDLASLVHDLEKLAALRTLRESDGSQGK